MAEALERCPRCRQTLVGFAVYYCPACGTSFCAGCDRADRPPALLGWLVASAAEAALDSCPVCTGTISDEDQVGTIARRA